MAWRIPYSPFMQRAETRTARAAGQSFCLEAFALAPSLCTAAFARTAVWPDNEIIISTNDQKQKYILNTFWRDRHENILNLYI
jgi:hypothetical protein